MAPLGSTTALFFDAYLDDPKTAGLPNAEMIPESRMLDRIVNADKAGLQIALHAIGDRANQTILNMFREVVKENGERDRRFRDRACSAPAERRNSQVRTGASYCFDAALSRNR